MKLALANLEVREELPERGSYSTEKTALDEEVTQRSAAGGRQRTEQ